jgi:Ca2+-binding RTX toxin-like protein
MPYTNNTTYNDVNGGVVPVTVSEPIVLENDASGVPSMQPSVTELQNGNFVTAWLEVSSDYTNFTIFAQVRDSAGVPVGEPAEIIGSSLAAPVVTALDGGGYALAYNTKIGTDYGIVTRVIDQDGTVGDEHFITSDPRGLVSQPVVTTLDSGNFIVAWSAGDHQLHYQLCNINGSPMDEQQSVPAPGTAAGASIAGLSGGGYAIAWTNPETNAVSVALYDPVVPGSGSPDMPRSILELSAGGMAAEGAQLSVAALDNGNFVVTWISHSNQVDVLSYRVVDYSTGEYVGGVGTANVTSGPAIHAPSVSALDDGGFVIAWDSTGTVDGDVDVVARRFDNDGTPRDDAEFGVDTQHLGTDEATPVLAPLANGGFAVAWTEYSSQGSSAQAAVVHPASGGDTTPPGDTSPTPTPNPIPDTGSGGDSGAGPTASFDVAGYLTPGGTGNTISFTVTYADHSGQGLDPASVGKGNISVSTMFGTSMPVVDAVLEGNTVTYTVEAPGGFWDRGDSGTYYVSLGTDLVQDKAGHVATAEQGSSFSFNVPVPYELHDDALSVSADQQFVTTLTVDEYDASGTWVLDGQSVEGLFSLQPEQSGNQAVLSIADKSLLPAVGETVSVSMHYYGQYQLDADGKPLPYQGVERTLYYVVTDGGKMVEFTPTEQVAGGKYTQVAARAVTTLASGDYVIVWEARESDTVNHTSDSTLYAQVRDASGKLVGQQIALTEPGDGVGQSDVEVAALKAGGYVVTYSIEQEDGNAVAYRIVGADGSVGAESIVATQTDYLVNPMVTTFDDGSYMLAWTVQNRIVMQQLSATGSPIGDQTAIDTDDHILNANIITLKNGGYVVSWADGPTQALRFALYQPDAAAGSVHDIIGGEQGYAGPATARLAAMADGGFVAVYSRFFDQMDDKALVYFQRYDADGKLIGEGVASTLAGGVYDAPDVAALSDGGFVVTWQTDNGDSDYQIVGRRFDTYGNAVDKTEFLVSDDHTAERDGSPLVTALDDKGFATVWSHQIPQAERADLVTNATGSAPIQPTEPTQPTEPSQPTEPTTPTTPTEPTQPTQPTEPAQPTQPEQPEQPTTPPTEPTQPITPITPTTPTQPTEPTQPAQPSDNTVHGTVDGVAVNTTPATTPTGAAGIIVDVPVITTTRAEDPATAHQTLADIPLAVKGADGSSKTLLTVSLPVGAGLQAEGSSALQSNAQALLDLIARIEAKTSLGSSTQTEMKGEGHGFLDALGQDVLLQTATLTPTVSGNAAPERILITGNSVSGANTGTAIGLVIDAHGVPSSTVLQLDNVDFAAIVGAATLRGGDGRNIVVGDDAAQNILLGADDDVLFGGAGNDIVGSAGGNDLLDGGSGDDIVVGGIGNDSLVGGAGSDALQGGRSDSGGWTFTLGADGKLSASHEMAVFAPGTLEAVTMAELDHANGDLSFTGAASAKLANLGLLYEAMFGRAPDLSGINYWAGKDLSVSEVAGFMMKSAEWAGDGGNALSDAQFVSALYQNALGRAADTEGFAFWTSKLDASGGHAQMTRAEVAAAIALSDEHRGQHSTITVGEGTLDGEQGWFATSGDDRLDGGAGNDTLVGGDGVDTIVYGGAHTGYKVLLGEDGQVRVEDKANGDLDTIRGIEHGEFADGTVDLSFSQADPGLLRELGTLYHAVLGRTADLGGFQWWMQQGLDAKGLVAGVMGSEEYKADYAALDDAHFVQALYQAAGLDGTAAGGVQGWQDYLSTHTRAELIGKWVGDAEVMAAQVDTTGLWLV